jgi:trimeric autotransporter adhesin
MFTNARNGFLPSMMVALTVIALFCTGAQAAGTPDRVYLFGDDADDPILTQDSDETPTLGGLPMANTIGGSQPLSIDSRLTDDVSLTDESDLSYAGGGGGPVYVDVDATGGLARPGAANGTFGLQFDGADTLFRNTNGGGLGAPATGDATYGQRYSGGQGVGAITTRYIDGWVYPTGGAGTRRDIVNDTFQFQVFINTSNNWAFTQGSNNPAAPALPAPTATVDTTTPAVLNQWTHVFHRTFTATAAVLYINGVAVGLTEADYNGGLVYNQTTPDVFQSISFGSNQGQTGNFFSGTLDDFTIGVSGNNTNNGSNGANWGDIDLRVDNDFIRQALIGIDPADVNMNGVVNQQDIDIFLANWRRNFNFNNGPGGAANARIVGDLNSRKLGDLNIDGVVNLADAFIMHANYASGSGGGTFDLSALGVPEPTSVALMTCGLVMLGWRLQRRHSL